jgi:hypothetical protein
VEAILPGWRKRWAGDHSHARRTAKMLGITVQPNLLVIADEVIEYHS